MAVEAAPAPQITFAIPFYRGRDYLERAIASVLRQTSPGWRLIVCDDGACEPGIAELVASYRDPRLAYHRNESHLGMAATWNRCLDLAGTDLVTLLHADDELLDGYGQQMIALAEQYPQAVLLFCGARIIDEASRPCFSFPDLYKRILVLGQGDPLLVHGQRGLSWLLGGNFIMCPTACYRRSRLGARRFSPRWQMVLDLDLFARLVLEDETLVGVAVLGYAYRRHSGNASAAYTHSLLRFHEEAGLYDELTQAALTRGWHQAARAARGKQIIKLHLLYRIVGDLLRLRLRGAWDKVKLLRHLAAGRCLPCAA